MMIGGTIGMSKGIFWPLLGGHFLYDCGGWLVRCIISYYETGRMNRSIVDNRASRGKSVQSARSGMNTHCL
jgi:hypothetical protein